MYGEDVRTPKTTKQGAKDTRLFSRGKTRHITWNEDNKPATITVNGTAVNFVYDGNGNRVRKIKGSNSTYYFGDAYETRHTVGIIHLFANRQRLASIRTDGKTQYYHGNHLGSASVVTDQNGNVKQKVEYYPFGTYRYGTTGYEQYATYDYDTTFPNANYTFTDQEDDDETGLYNYDARLYDPQLGRFISADTIVPRPEDLQSFNRYSYCSNNPLVYTDPSGHDDGEDRNWGDSVWDWAAVWCENGPLNHDITFHVNGESLTTNCVNFEISTESSSFVGTNMTGSGGSYSGSFGASGIGGFGGGNSADGIGSTEGASTNGAAVIAAAVDSLNTTPGAGVGGGSDAVPGWVDTAEALIAGVAAVSLDLSLAPTGITNVVGAAGLAVSGTVGVGLSIYKSYLTHNWTPAIISAVGAVTGLTAVGAVSKGVNYSFQAGRFYTVFEKTGMWSFMSTGAGVAAYQTNAAINGLTTASEAWLQAYYGFGKNE